MKCYPLRLRIVGVTLTVAVVVGTVVGWIALPTHLRAQFTPFQLATLVALLLAVLVVIGSVSFSYVEAGPKGLVFRNGLRTHRVTWDRVTRVSYRNGEPWASVWVMPGHPGPGETADASTTVREQSGTAVREQSGPDGHRRESDHGPAPEPHKHILLGIQRSDRARAERAVAQLRRLHAATRSPAT